MANVLNRHFSIEYIYLKWCSISLATRTMHIKSTVRFHLTPTRMTTIRRISNSKSQWGHRAQKTLIHTGGILYESARRFFKKLNLELLYAPARSLLVYLKKTLSQHATGILAHPRLLLHSYTARKRKHSRCPSTDEWVQNMQTREHFNSATKKNKVMTFVYVPCVRWGKERGRGEGRGGGRDLKGQRKKRE